MGGGGIKFQTIEKFRVDSIRGRGSYMEGGRGKGEVISSKLQRSFGWTQWKRVLYGGRGVGGGIKFKTTENWVGSG